MLDMISKVLKDPAIQIFNAYKDYIPTLDIDSVSLFLTEICSFIKKNSSSLGTIEYILKLNFENTQSTTKKISSAWLLNAFQNHNKIVEINAKFSVLSNSKLYDLSNSGIANYSKNDNSTCIFVHNGTDLTIYINGFPIREFNINYPESMPSVNKKTARVANDYKLSLIDFYNIRVKNNITNHWKDKGKRILLGGKTEDIFQDSLYSWLYENINDAIVSPKVKKISKDETDIEIIAHGGNNYLIEIKWLGKNEKNTTYDIPRLRDSIMQVKNYLKTDTKVLDATLLVYDGRPITEFNKIKCIRNEDSDWKEIKKCSGQSLPLKGNCYIFFLISESASQRKN